MMTRITIIVHIDFGKKENEPIERELLVVSQESVTYKLQKF